MRRRVLTFDDLAAGLVWVVLAALACLSPAQGDTWWHLRAGQEVLRTGHVPATDTWSWTASGRPWPDHEWGWQVLAYAVHALGGMPLLALADAVLAVGALVLATRTAPRATGVTTVLLALAAPAISAEWALRPQVASLLCSALLVLLLSRERFAWLVPLFVVWANLHGAVATGGLVLVAVTVGALVVRRRDQHARRRARHLLLVSPLCALATLATPLGTHLWGYLLGSLGRSRSASRLGLVQEWRSALHVGPVEVVLGAWLVALAVLLVRHRGRPLPWAGLVPVVAALALAPLALTSVRLVPFLLLAALPAAAWLLPERARDEQVRLARPLLAAAALVAGTGVALAWVHPPQRLGWQPVTPAAAGAVAACGGRTWNTYDEGGALLWFVPGTRVFVDSRLDPYPLGFLRRVARAEATGRVLPLVGTSRCAVVPPGSPADVTLRGAGWLPSYADARLVVLRRG